MAFVHGKDTAVFAGIYDLSGFFNQATVSKSRQVVSTDVFGAAGDAKTFIAGLGEGTVALGGLLDTTATTGSDPVLNAALDGAQIVVSVSAEGASVIGQRVSLLNARQDSYPWRSPVDDAVRLNSGRMADGGLRSGVVLKEFDAETATGNFTSVDNTTSTALGAVGHLHVTAFSGTDATITITDSTDDAVFVSHIPFTQVTGTTSERLTSTGTVDRYVRVELTGTFTSVTFTVGFARNLFT
jgi:hypothetical protein